jgi:hypothetical protein
VDIRIEQGTTLVYVEVKHNAPLGPQQLEVDWNHPHQTDRAHKQLVLLSRSKSAALGTALPSQAFFHCC